MLDAPLTVTEVVPRTLGSGDVATPEGRDWLRERYARDGAYVRLNMVTSLTGSAAGEDGTSETLTSRIDRSILGVIRRDADVVVVGAQSVRAEGYVVPRTARLAVVTSSGRLTGHRLSLEHGAEPDRVLLVCPAGVADEVAERAAPYGATVVPVPGGPRLSPRAILDALAARGLSRVVCEGGPSLAAQFSEAGVIDEYCVTVAPVIGPAPAPFLRVSDGARPRTEVSGMLVDEAGFSYLRLRARE
ncbi:dihydrofolate reductase family protein [uncultured Microbacterium sp.]|uniref:dihydrofolate reductase family protein n=1 Tax=uncultured Microbacterium sp. TaxID=191216 RepID=UPI0035C9B91A